MSENLPSNDSDYVDLEDNRIAAALSGQHDAHLALFEEMLNARIDAVGNRIIVSGPEGARGQALKALESLTARLNKGETVNASDVRAAIKFAAIGGNPTTDGPTIKTPRRQIFARTPNQATYLKQLMSHDLTFGIGPAGTGKTYLAVAHAVGLLMSNKVERIILSRPALEAGERIGFLPGDMKEKVDPFLRPLYDALHDMMHTDYVERRIAAGDIEIAPIAFMRGRTLARSAIILDEAQNATPAQMKMFLTRLGEGAHMVITGDPDQTDLPQSQISGLSDALETLGGVEGIAISKLTQADIIRHKLVSRIVQAYDSRRKRTADRP